MSWFKRVFGSSSDEAVDPASEGADAAATAEDREFEDLLRELRVFGSAKGLGAKRALEQLRRFEDSPEEAKVLGAITQGLATEVQADELRVACAQLLSLRGKADRARDVLESVQSVQGLMLAAELHAAAGQLALAVSTIERVLARAIRTPGARDRHRRWLEQLGRVAHRATAVDDGATVVAELNSEALPFRLLREVARGGAGTVYEAEDVLLGRRLAFKRYHDIEGGRGQLEHEARTAAEFRGPGVLPIYDADPKAGWMATEWIGGGSLADRFRLGDMDSLLPIRRWFLPLTQTLARIHQAGWVHADVKPGNILMRAADDPIVADFGAARRQGEAHARGTLGYMSPERLAGGVADPKDDVYALGRILEDAINACEQDGDAPDLVRLCIGAASQRPADASVVLQQLLADG